MTVELKKRIITSILLFILLILMSFYTYILIASLIIIGIIAWIEFYALISKIYKKKNYNNIALRFALKATSLLYLSYIVFIIIFTKLNFPYLYIFIIYIILISVMTDIGGLIVGKFFKGKKLTKISPNKTISGSIGSLVFSLFLIPFFFDFLSTYIDISFFDIVLITLSISLISQLGDLFISLMKRKANVKNTSDLLPGHGGILDRIDGIIFAIPLGILLFNLF
jgi:phosphatidate cytidylyltransferase|tara:strand:+ start:667 stop:1338 length:672 start_codon:yes stop_codon:yes gene_type:complete